MSNLWVLLVFVPPQNWTGPRLITVIYIFPLQCPRQNTSEVANRPGLKIILREFKQHMVIANQMCYVLLSLVSTCS